MLIPCLGRLHIAMNFLGVIGRHMSESGLSELWIGCDLLGSNAAQHIMAAIGRKGICTCVTPHNVITTHNVIIAA